MVTKLKRPSWISTTPSGVKAPSASSWGVSSHATSTAQASRTRQTPWSSVESPLRPEQVGQHLYTMVAAEALPPSGEEVCSKCQGGPGHACRRDVWAQFLLNISKTVELVCSNSHCWVGEEGSQAFMKILWSLSLQSMQLLLTGWYRVLSLRYFHSWLPFML